MSQTTDFFTKCLPPIRNNSATIGLLTLCDAEVPEVDELESIFLSSGKYRAMGSWFKHDLELKACRAKQNSMYDFLMSQGVDMSHKLRVDKVNTGLWRIAPYFLALRKQPINNNYWKATAGAASNGTLDDNTGPNAGTHWQLNLESTQGIPAHARWFNARERLYLKSLGAGSVVSNTQWQVVSSVVADVGGTNKVRIVLLPLNSGAFGSGAEIEDGQGGRPGPTIGVAVRGTANISNFEAFCSFPPGLIPNTEDDYWIESSRDVFRSDEQYEEWRMALLDNNPLFANVFDLPTQDYNRQVGEDWQRRFVNSFLNNKRISANQTLSAFNALTEIPVTDWSQGGNGTRCVGLRANAVGIREQYRQLNRVFQAAGQPLNIISLTKSLYNMMRVREGSNPAAAQIFEITIPSSFYPNFSTAMFEYYDKMWGGLVQNFRDISATAKVSNMGFAYTDFPLVWPQGVILRVIAKNRALDDEATEATNAGVTLAGNTMWISDWTKVYPGIFGSKTVTRETGDLDVQAQTNMDAACTIESHKSKTRMTGMAYSFIHECPQGDLLIEGFSTDKPVVTDVPELIYDPACS